MDYEVKEKIEIKGAIEDNRLYDFICSNYYRIEDNILNELLLEVIAMLNLEDTNNQKQLIENLKEYKEWEI